MPVERVFFHTLGLQYVRPKHPFVPDDLVERALKDLPSTDPYHLLGAPQILDFRAVDLLRFEAEDFRRVVRRRMRIGPSVPSGPCAFVCAEGGSFGMLRMYTTYGDLSGFRKEELTFVTTSITEAAHWIVPFLTNAHANAEDVLESVAQKVAG